MTDIGKWTEEDYEQLSPGIRDTVRWFHQNDWKTTDSGDGFNYARGMPGGLEYPMVVVDVLESTNHICGLTEWADELWGELSHALPKEAFASIDIQAMYNPRDGNEHILVTGEGLLSLKPEPT